MIKSTEQQVREYIARVVADAPPLSMDQKARLTALFTSADARREAEQEFADHAQADLRELEEVLRDE